MQTCNQTCMLLRCATAATSQNSGLDAVLLCILVSAQLQGCLVVPLPALQYGAVMIVDPEEENYLEEGVKLAVNVQKHGRGLLVFAKL